MTGREVASLTLKLLGVYTIIQALIVLQSFGTVSLLPQVSRGSITIDAWSYVTMLAPFLMVLGVAVLLLTQSETLARMITKEEHTFGLPGTPAGRDIQAIAFSVAGVLVFLRGLPGIIQLLMTLWYSGLIGSPRTASLPSGYFWQTLWRSGFSPVVECVLGALLFFRARGLANVWHRLQRARYVKIDDAQQPERKEK